MLRPRGLFVTSAADMFVAPDVTDYLEEAFKQARLPYEILIQDVQVCFFYFVCSIIVFFFFPWLQYIFLNA